MVHFPYSKPQVETVVAYVRNQETHHMKKTFLEEYKDLLIELILIMTINISLRKSNNHL